ncbi:ATP-binding cassette domain-containing protein [Aureibaculum algae]|uniref:ATP-binding cassette domain-containing protein n=1 Tax=Aureibaculum algae TaxID=2584122 RepID=A0A5B7TZ49_9FLAO|nr:ATP-binding cassette domain-containing protein [Aureibaculum algae]QCX40713.1 ATP-binding cassette domain-containing protein [Aureibaculum algae]
MINVENITKQYALSKKQRKELQINSTSVAAVNNVSFICKPGRVFSLLGPNGAGKTSLLRMVSTILKPSSGDIKVDGVSVIDNPQEVRRKIGFLTGSTNLYDRLTPGEIVKYFADLHGMERSLFNERKENLFEQLNINEFSKKRIGQLSTGMKQKVSIARSMIHDPSVVIFDEPTSGLDVITANSIIELIRQCKKDGKTVIFSSHIMSEVDLLCDDLAIIAKGNLIYNDTMDAYRKQSEGKSLIEAFINIVNQNN